LDTKATTKIENPNGKDLIDCVLEKRGISLGELAETIGYAERTLRGVRYGEVPMSEKFHVWLQKMLADPKMEPSETSHAMPPPHTMQTTRLREDPALPAAKLSPKEYTDAVALIGTLFHTNPEAFRAALTILRQLEDPKKNR